MRWTCPEPGQVSRGQPVSPDNPHCCSALHSQLCPPGRTPLTRPQGQPARSQVKVKAPLPALVGVGGRAQSRDTLDAGDVTQRANPALGHPPARVRLPVWSPATSTRQTGSARAQWVCSSTPCGWGSGRGLGPVTGRAQPCRTGRTTLRAACLAKRNCLKPEPKMSFFKKKILLSHLLIFVLFV